MTEQVTVQRLIPAPAEAIFDLLADPGRHHEIDGSGTIVGARSAGERRLALGDSFGMDMDWGVKYATKNVGVEFEENRRIAWQSRSPLGFLKPLVGGRIWRYELEPVEGGTIVRETWDTRQEALPSRYVVRATLTDLTRRNMEKTLQRIQDVVTA